ncbi:hypothetical protein LptCag_0593 [Leptospirillum ferriphilum]|jgi:predicted CopG family antitoxin|uniref:Uncharacterized protein n=2 Tax=Leptospirillum TaxID=179 RepID=A0A094WEA5_9BACT|nr:MULTISPECIES: hypothetical protein [Leptospirillum]AKS24120.1 hypothetical protein ABH19_10770 [Leptospirillum sp. Group II 'CF-1']EDZ37942.1 MAG: Hypothetical protein CGL2_11185002 [Leptospirillum sp. Group II '5-way CG']KGA93967.1 hypothetical protein LptCag_0593 [Leptospirillum ferriphilum]MDA8150885.1 hypothetical protein [Nitrospiraceae bacterium]
MDKTVSASVPEGDYLEIKNMAEREGESVSGLIKNLLKREMSGEEMRPVPDTKLEEILTLLRRLVESKPVQNPDKNPDPETAKKIEKLEKTMSGFPSILDTKIQNVLNEIGKIPESNGGQVGVGIDPEPGNKILESLTKTADKLEAFSDGIGGVRGEAVGNVSFRNPEFWKKSLAIVGIWSLIFAGAMGWGTWKIYQHGNDAAELEGIGIANPVYKSFYHLMQCDQPGWKTEWSKDGKTLYCDLDRNPLTGKPYKLRIR